MSLRSTRAADPLAAVTLTYLFIQVAVQQPSRNVGRRMVVARSNCSRIVVVNAALSNCKQRRFDVHKSAAVPHEL